MGKLTQKQFEIELLDSAFNFEVNAHDKDRWLLSDGGLDEVVNNFNLLYDYYYGKTFKNVSQLYEKYGLHVLSAELQKKYFELATDPEAQKEWMVRSRLKINSIWYFMVSLCYLLNVDDHEFTAEEGYWLGFIDEIYGSKLPTLRASEEAKIS